MQAAALYAGEYEVAAAQQIFSADEERQLVVETVSRPQTEVGNIAKIDGLGKVGSLDICKTASTQFI